MEQQPLYPSLPMPARVVDPLVAAAAAALAPPRLRRPNRAQAIFQPVFLDELLEEDHLARHIWELTGRWDLSGLYQKIQARGERPGRPATDPRLLLALWLYAYTQNVGSARELERLSTCHDAYRWICGGVSVDYHLLSDFRVEHGQELDDLLTQMVAMLLSGGLIEMDRLSQDGTRVRASAGNNSYRRKETLEQHLQQARQHVEAMKQQAEDPNVSNRQRAARQRAARERQERLERALVELEQVQAAKEQQKDKASKRRQPRASSTDPQSRVMKLPQGAFGPGYNVQFASVPQGRAIVGVEVSNAGSDVHESEPMRKQVEDRTGRKVHQHLLDGGYVGLDSIERAAMEQVRVYAPLPQSANPTQPKPGDGPGVKAWRERMGTAEARAIYKERSATSETVNGETRSYRGLTQVLVRGLQKVRCVALFSALAYNLAHFAAKLVQ
jgi:transposase